MTIILKNPTQNDIIIESLGIKITSSTQAELDYAELDAISGDEELKDYIRAGSIIVNDGTNDLSISAAIDYITSKPDLSNYYNINQVDGLLGDKSNTGHTHDGLYYRKADVDNLVSSSGSYGIKGSVNTYEDLQSIDDQTLNNGDIYIVKETMGDSENSWLNGWAHRLQVKVQKEHIHGDLTNFPIYLDATKIPEDHPFWQHVKSDGSDIRITDSNHNQLPVEIVNMSVGNFTQGLDLYEYHNTPNAPNNHSEFITSTTGQPDESQVFMNQIDGENEAPISQITEDFSLKFEGYIYAPTTGVYTFATDSDDASEIEVDGQIVVSWYGSHGADGDLDEHTGQITLSQGYHEFIYRYQQGSGDMSWRAGWAKPSEGEEDEDISVINASYFYRGSGKGEIWFKGNLTPGTDNIFYLYYGNSNANLLLHDDEFGRNNVWSEYELVYHFEEVEDASNYTAIDSTGKHDGTHDNTDPANANLIGKSMDYDGDDYTDIGTLDTDSTWTGLYVSTWVYKDNSDWSNDQRFIDKSHGHDLSDNAFVLMVGSNKELEFRFNSDSAYHQLSFMRDLPECQWTKVTGMWDAASGMAKVLKDGTKAREFNLSGRNHVESSTDTTRIGDAPDGGRGYHGVLDEMRVAKKAFSEQWEQTEYEMIMNTSSFYNIGDEEDEATASQQSQSIPGIYTPTTNTFVYMKFNGGELNQIGPYQPSVHSQPEYEPGLSGQCAVLDTDDYYYFNSNPFFGEGNELSIGMFVKFSSFQTYDTLVQRYQSGQDEGYRFGLHNGKIELELGDNSDFLRLTSPNQIPLDEWVHIGFAYDGNSGITKLYKNGRVVNSSSSFSGRINSDNKTLYINWDSSYNHGANVKIEDLFATNEYLMQEDFETAVYGESLEEYHREGFYQWNGSSWDYLAPNTSGSSVQHNSLQGLNEGDFQHLTSLQLQALTTANNTTLHTHDDQYYTKNEIDNKMVQKADANHTHSNYYTKTEVDNLLDSIDYDAVSNNDSSTNITGSELEQLTNGSNADGLHTHSNSSGGGSASGGLDEAYDSHSQWSHGTGREIFVDHGPVDIQASGGFAPLRLAEINYVPNQWLNTGHMCVYDSELFIYDATRSCWNSVSGYYIGGGYNSNNIKNTYLKGYNGTSFTDDVGWVAPWDGVIVSLSASSNDDTNNAIEVRKNGNSTAAKVWFSGDRKVWATNIDVKFNEGDVLNFYATEWENHLDRPQAWAIIKRRI